MNVQAFIITIIVLVGVIFLTWTWIKKPFTKYSVKRKALFLLFSAFTIVFGVFATLNNIALKVLNSSLDPNYDLYSLIGFTIFCIAAMYISKDENGTPTTHHHSKNISIINSPKSSIIISNKKGKLDDIFESRIWIFVSITAILIFWLYIGIMGLVLGLLAITVIVYLFDEIIND